MRGETERQATMMMALTPEGFVPKDHPLRRIKPLADSALGRMCPCSTRYTQTTGGLRFRLSTCSSRAC